jgi:hypothetical protein
MLQSFALKNHLSGEHTLTNQDELLTLVKVLTPEAQPIGSAVGGSSRITYNTIL